MEKISMNDRRALCEKIRAIFPDIGVCGLDLNVDFDEGQKAWVIALSKNRNIFKVHISPEDATACMQGKKCANLALAIGQLRSNMETV